MFQNATRSGPRRLTLRSDGSRRVSDFGAIVYRSKEPADLHHRKLAVHRSFTQPDDWTVTVRMSCSEDVSLYHIDSPGIGYPQRRANAVCHHRFSFLLRDSNPS